MYSKTVHADHSDRYEVASTDFGQVRSDVVESDGTETTTYLDPAQARRLARALKRAANVAEGKPAKPKKSVIDGDGDLWTLREDGLYRMARAPESDTGRTRGYIRRTYGLHEESA